MTETTKRPKRWLLPLLVLLAIAAAGLLLPRPGGPAPDVSFATVDGGALRLADLRGKVVVVNFWSTSCGVCMAEMPQFIKTHLDYAPHGLETVAVAMAYDSAEGVREYARAQGLPFRVAHDAGGAGAAAFGGVRATPTTLVIDRQGRIVEQQRGALDWGHMRTVLQGLLEQPA